MTKADMIAQTFVLLDQMRPHLLKSKVPEKYTRLFYTQEDLEKLPVTIIRDAYNWLEKILGAEWREYSCIRRLLPEMAWEMYEAMGDFEDHREVKLLRLAQKNLRSIFISRERPTLFKKGKVVDELKKQIRKDKSKTKDGKCSDESSPRV